jgi:hypothetical protein
MAACEKCGKSGFVPYQMFIDPVEQKFVGPCCATVGAQVHVVQPPAPSAPAQIHVLSPPDDVEYGIEVSNKVGVRAFANYHGLEVTFERSPDEIRKWAETQGIVEPKKAQAQVR